MSARTLWLDGRRAACAADVIEMVTGARFDPADFAEDYLANSECRLRSSGEHAAAEALLAFGEEELRNPRGWP